MPDDLFGDDLDFGQTIEIPRFGVGQKIFRRYILKKILGRGGMGIVWLAEDEDLERLVALKVLPETLCHDRESLEALKHETKLGLHLAHPNIVRIYDFQRDDNAAAISMEYVDGATFSEMRTTKPTHVFDPADLDTYVEALCDALHYAHNRERIVHRDLKPRNLMLNSHGDLKIADFGISRTISDSMIVLTGMRGSTGSPPYISPQQWDGDPPTPLDDIYSVGATLYELLSSKPPFIGVVDWQQVHYKIPPPISKRRADLGITGAAPIPAEWEETIAACLAKDPKGRPQTIRALLARLTINGQMPVAPAETRPAPVVSSGPKVAKPVDSSDDDLFDEATQKDLPEDMEDTTIDTATVRAEPKLDAPTAPLEPSSAPASEPILDKLGGPVQDEVTPQHVSTAHAEPKPDASTASVERSSAPVSEPILRKLDEAVQGRLPPQPVSTARVEPKLETPTAPVERSGAPASEPILKKPDAAIQGQVTPQHVSTVRAEPTPAAPIPPVERSSAPVSEPIRNKLGDAVKEEVTPQHVSTARAEPKLDTPITPVERYGAPASEPIVDKLGGPVKEEATPRHVFEPLSKTSQPTGDAGAPPTRRTAEPAPPLEPPVTPSEPIDVWSYEKAAPTNRDVAFPSTEVARPDRSHLIRLRPGKVPLWVWVAAVAAVLILGAIVIAIFKPKPPPLPPGPQVADLRVESEPSGANLTLDKSPPIKTPHTFKDLKFGRHRLTIKLDGYSPVERDIEFSGASPLKIVLPPIEEIAKLSVRSDPPGASIRLDGTLPQESNTFRNVKFGNHRVTATMEGFEPKEQFLVVTKDTTSEIILKLERVKDPLQPLLDELKKAEAAHDWVNYHMASLQLLGHLTSPKEPASKEHREIFTTVIEGLRTKGAALTSEEFRAYEKNLNDAARLDIIPAILIVADKLKATNCQEAFNWYNYAAEKKYNAYAMTRIAWVYSKGECGQQVDKGRSFEWFQRGRQAGDTEAARMVGVCYLYGEGTPKNEDEGIRILEDLVKLGEPKAITLIGQCYYYGRGHFKEKSEEERYRMAKSFFDQAILAGDWDACGYLGIMYEWGQGVKEDWRTAARLYFQGVEHESPICMYYYAQALENHGSEIRKMLDRPQDDAKTYYVKAAQGRVREAREWCVKNNVKWESGPTPTPTAPLR
jgi:serine/threonine protein kinase/TPR repeat protein